VNNLGLLNLRESVRVIPILDFKMSPNGKESATKAVAGGERQVKDSISFFYILFGIALLLPYSVYVVLANNPTSLGGFAYHPPLGAIALSAMAYGIAVLQPSKKTNLFKDPLTLHVVLLGFVALPLILISGTIMYQRKENNSQPHYTSWHGILGSLVALGIIFQSVFGSLLSELYVPRKYAKYHRQSGYMLLTLMALTLSLGGLFSSFIIKHAWTASRFLAFGLGPLVMWGGVMTRIRPKKLL